MQHHQRPARTAQSGVTLIVVLLILVVVTVLGIGGAQIALLGERSTRYDRDYLVATQAAEAALMDAEFDIGGPNAAGVNRMAIFSKENTGIFVEGCSNNPATRGLCARHDDANKPTWATVDFLDDSDNARTVAFGTFTGRIFQKGDGVRPELAPRYIIELIEDGFVGGSASGPTKKMYRITAIGFGPRRDVQVVMQTAFRKVNG